MPNSSPGSPLVARSQGRGRPGGDESRARLLATAGELFAERGYNGVSTRELAKAADVNVSAIAYYFRVKEGPLSRGIQTVNRGHQSVFPADRGSYPPRCHRRRVG